MDYGKAISSLLDEYSKIYSQKGAAPEWAVHKKSDPTQLVHPTIPFVGKKFFEQPVKLLIYASAENLNGYENSGHLDDNSFAQNRHRNYFDVSVESTTSFFPYVHLGPIESGALPLCALHILSKLTGVDKVEPQDFLEMISFGNYGKYTQTPIMHQQGNRITFENSDYAGDPERLSESQPYVAVDLKVLKPDYILMIGSTYDGSGRQKAFIEQHAPAATVIPIYQMFPRVINRYIKGKYSPYSLDELTPTEQEWYDKFNANTFTGKNKENFLCVYRYLDSKL